MHHKTPAKIRCSFLHPPTQTKIFDAKPFTSLKGEYSDTEDTWGHSPDEIQHDSVFRILLQNTQSLKLFTSPVEGQYSLAITQDLGVSALCMPEMNINWGHKLAHSILQAQTRKAWQNSSYSVSYIDENFTGPHQPGGRASIITNKWISRIIEKGTDPFGLGWWTFITLWGKQESKITITAY